MHARHQTRALGSSRATANRRDRAQRACVCIGGLRQAPDQCRASCLPLPLCLLLWVAMVQGLLLCPSLLLLLHRGCPVAAAILCRRLVKGPATSTHLLLLLPLLVLLWRTSRCTWRWRQHAARLHPLLLLLLHLTVQLLLLRCSTAECGTEGALLLCALALPLLLLRP